MPTVWTSDDEREYNRLNDKRGRAMAEERELLREGLEELGIKELKDYSGIAIADLIIKNPEGFRDLAQKLTFRGRKLRAAQRG